MEPSTKATLSVDPASIDEDGGEQEVTVTASLDGQVRSSETSVTVTFSSDGTAEIGADKDYTVLPAGTGTEKITTGTITIPANSRSGSTTFRFTPVDDTAVDER